MMRRAASSQVRATKRHYRCMQCQNTPHRTARLASISSAAELYSLKPDRCRSHSTNLVNTKARSLEHSTKRHMAAEMPATGIRLQLENYPLADGGNVDEQLPYSNGLRKAGRNSIATTGYDDGSRMTYESILLQQNRLHPGLNPWKGNDYRRRSTYDNQVSAIYIM
ncbi:unnamed protein product [Enterobius vermicularis]|uniref:Uncharacterized protein n=1 Tax=Enterobius vermicularis TaxID=51028 RepID=A0A0N4UU22_ENTVE|nr:unnamed protein product [Enterobius vermicularis]